MALLAGVIQHLRMDHPPFPQAGPTVPQHAQSRGTGHDGAGDSEEGMEDQKGEYESSQQVDVLDCILILIFPYFVGYISDTLMYAFYLCLYTCDFYFIIYLNVIQLMYWFNQD